MHANKHFYGINRSKHCNVGMELNIKESATKFYNYEGNIQSNYRLAVKTIKKKL